MDLDKQCLKEDHQELLESLKRISQALETITLDLYAYKGHQAMIIGRLEGIKLGIDILTKEESNGKTNET